MLSAGPTPRIETDDWKFEIKDETGTDHSWTWDEMQALVEDITVDIHCVTHWTKLDMAWRGVSLDKLFENVESEYDYVMAHSYGGYTTNVPLEDLLDGKSLDRVRGRRRAARPRARRAGAAAGAAPLLLEEREVGARR